MVREMITTDKNPNIESSVVREPTAKTIAPASLLFCVNNKIPPITARIKPNNNIESRISVNAIVSSPI